ncbi:MAG: hypothetical protein ACLUD2_15035 [Clostridium sp.]
MKKEMCVIIIRGNHGSIPSQGMLNSLQRPLQQLPKAATEAAAG